MHPTQLLKLHRPPAISQCREAAPRNSRFKGSGKHVSEAGKHTWISARVFHPPACNDVAEWPKKSRAKVPVKCQQKSSKVARGQILTVLPASVVNTSVMKSNLEARVPIPTLASSRGPTLASRSAVLLRHWINGSYSSGISNRFCGAQDNIRCY